MARDDAPTPTFLLDEMLGQLAKWLRILGYDAAYARDVEDDDLLDRAGDEARILVTRDVELAERAEHTEVEVERIAELDPDDQLDELVAARGLTVDEERFLSRCTRCNVPVEEVALDDVVDAVPEKARDHETYWRCPACERVYWAGTHVAEMRERVEELGEG